MKSKIFKSILFSVLLMLTFSLGCFDDSSSDNNGGGNTSDSENSGDSNNDSDNSGDSNNDGDNSGGGSANGVFTKLIVGRFVYSAAPDVKIDTIEALFSDTYDLCATESDLQPAGVMCNAYTLAWNGQLYNYSEIPDADGFLVTGNTYTFNVTESAEVPDLTTSIDFPDTEPEITSPSDGNSVSSGGFTVEWDDPEGSGTVQIILLNTNTTESAAVETDDDGTYIFSDTDLSGISPGSCYLQLEKYNQNNINAAGYDSRSVIRARYMCSVLITLED